jgi:hypothetical protein
MSGIDGVIRQLEAQKAAIERALAALREVEGIQPAGEPAIKSAPGRKASAKKSARSEGQKKRWALKKATEASAPVETAEAAPRKSRLSEEGRKRISEATKKRWAAKRAVEQPKKRAGRPKKVA